MPEEIITAADGTPLQNFTDLLWPTYLSAMSQNGTFGDHMLHINMLHMNCTMSSLRFFHLNYPPGYTTTISSMAADPLCTFNLEILQRVCETIL